MLERDGQELILAPVTDYLSGDASAIWEMLHHPCTVVGLGDGGAHVTRTCDASVPTFMLTHWARDRKRGEKLSLEEVVRKQTAERANCSGSPIAAFWGGRKSGSERDRLRPSHAACPGW